MQCNDVTLNSNITKELMNKAFLSLEQYVHVICIHGIQLPLCSNMVPCSYLGSIFVVNLQ